MASEQKEQENTLLPSFVSALEELLNGLHEVFPECDLVKKRLLKFRAFVKSPDVINDQQQVIEAGAIKMDAAKMLIKDWHSQMSPLYEIVRKRDITALFGSELRLISELDLRTKWADPEFDAESKENLLQYIDSLNMYAQMYCSIPSKMLTKIEALAQDLAQKMANGESSMASLDIMKLGESIIQGTTEDEMREFAGSMGDIQKMMQMQLAQLPPGATANIPGMPDLGGMMKMMNSVMKFTQ